MEHSVKQQVDEGPKASSHDQRDQPPLLGCKFELDEAAQGGPYGEAKEPNSQEVNHNPAENVSRTAVDHISGNPLALLFDVSFSQLNARSAQEISEELQDQKSKEREPNRPGKQSGSDVKVPALPECKGKNGRETEGKSRWPLVDPRSYLHLRPCPTLNDSHHLMSPLLLSSFKNGVKRTEQSHCDEHKDHRTPDPA